MINKRGKLGVELGGIGWESGFVSVKKEFHSFQLFAPLFMHHQTDTAQSVAREMVEAELVDGKDVIVGELMMVMMIMMVMVMVMMMMMMMNPVR